MGSAADSLHAEPAISRELDGRLSWRERRRLHAHLRHCEVCADFARFQRRRRAALLELRRVPLPESIEAFRPGANERFENGARG
jgi:anti-sigma factor RsiW